MKLPCLETCAECLSQARESSVAFSPAVMRDHVLPEQVVATQLSLESGCSRGDFHPADFDTPLPPEKGFVCAHKKPPDLMKIRGRVVNA